MRILWNVVMGGCVSSGHFERRHQPNVFHVWNVDEYGSPVTPGHIELTDSSLVLHQKSAREAVIWPMRSLRRYGFDAELFSFESGRRCTTGPGVYAFKCRRAETLFNMLQEKILSTGQDDLSNHSGVTIPPPPPPPPQSSATTATPLINNPTQQQQQQFSRQISPPLSDNDNYLEPIVINRSNSNSSHHPYANDMPPTVESEVNYVNTSPELVTRQLSSSSEPQPQLSSSSVSIKTVNRGHSLDDETNYAKLDDLLKQEHTANRHLYMNVTVSATQTQTTTAAAAVNNESQPNLTSDETAAESFSCDHCYANVAPVSSSSSTSSAILTSKAMRHSKSMFNYPRQVNYAILDLRKRSRNNNNSVKVSSAEEETTLSIPPSNATLQGYAKIDFDKTFALSNSINPSLDDDQAVRKTRHNSNASSLLPKRTSFAEGE